MLTREEYVEACALRRQGWPISAIARRLGRDRKTVRSYLSGKRSVGLRSPTRDTFLRFSHYCRQRLHDDPHLPAAALFAEVVELGYPGGYSTFTRALRRHQVRPPCERCHGTPAGSGTPAPRSAGEDVRFDWLRFPDPPAHWGYGSDAHVLVASLTRTERWRAALAESDEFPQLVEATDQVLRRLGGTGERWLFCRMPAVCSPVTGRPTQAFARVARYYGVTVDCRPREDGHDGRTDKGLRVIADLWWRTVRDTTGFQAAQDGLDQLAAWRDGPLPPSHDTQAAGAASGLLELPATPFPARVCAVRTVTCQNTVAFQGNFYAVPPDLAGAVVEVRRRLDEAHLSIATARGAVLARHPLAPRGAGLVVTGPGQDIRLERPDHVARADATPCRKSTTRRPPLSQAALAEADALRGHDPVPGPGTSESAVVAADGASPAAEPVDLSPGAVGPTGYAEARTVITTIEETVRFVDADRTGELLADLAHRADMAVLHALRGAPVGFHHGHTR